MNAIGMQSLTLTNTAQVADLKYCQGLRDSRRHGNEQRVDHSAANWQSMRIMILEDARNAAARWETIVGGWGDAFQIVHNSSQRPIPSEPNLDVVLLDLESPLIFTRRAAVHLRRDLTNKQCLIIAIVARRDEQHRRVLYEAGIDWVLGAPVDPTNLETLLMLESIRINRAELISASAKEKDSCRSVPDQEFDIGR